MPLNARKSIHYCAKTQFEENPNRVQKSEGYSYNFHKGNCIPSGVIHIARDGENKLGIGLLQNNEILSK